LNLFVLPSSEELNAKNSSEPDSDTKSTNLPTSMSLMLMNVYAELTHAIPALCVSLTEVT
jgi:hypothetical protein